MVILALLATVQLGVPDGSEFLPGLWLTSLTFYTRLIALGVGLLIVLVVIKQPRGIMGIITDVMRSVKKR